MKEYQNRWFKPLVNPGFLFGDYEKARQMNRFEEFIEADEECSHAWYHGMNNWRSNYEYCQKCGAYRQKADV